MRFLKIKRKKYFAGRSTPYTLTILDSLGKRSVGIKNGETLSVPTDDGEVTLTVGALTATGYAESAEFTVSAGGDTALAIETRYSIYNGSEYIIKRTDNE